MSDAILIRCATCFTMNCMNCEERVSHPIIRYVKCALRDGLVEPRDDSTTNAYAHFAITIR
jgi:hypothetical protein